MGIPAVRLQFPGSDPLLEPVMNKKGDKIMKTKIFIVFILVAFVCLPLKALAYERNFPAGSIIIPMDAFYQPDADGGILEAYGLAYYLLDHQDPQCLTDAATDPVTIACQETCAEGDTACELACVETFQDECEHTVAVSWVINDQKTSVDGVDLVIDVTAETLTAMGISAVVKEYDHAGGTNGLTYNLAVDPDDSVQRVTYSGSLFIIDVQDLEDGVEDQVYDIINNSSWAAVNVHVAQVPFAAPVYRDMRGTPPKIALMNNSEKTDGGNAAILESYLRLAGICTYAYEVVTPFQIRDGILLDKGYDFLWAPHWHGSGTAEDTQTIVDQIGAYLKAGKGLLAECGSIEEFEQLGHFLTTSGTGMDYNGGSNNAEDIIYLDVTKPNGQIGEFFYEPEGGSIHNWRPFGGPDAYNDTVTRFASDTVDVTGWDYYVGGYAFGDRNYGYAVYLGGHSYASCGSGSGDVEVDPELYAHPIDLEFDRDLAGTAGTRWMFWIEYTVTRDGIDYNFDTGYVAFSIDDLHHTFYNWDDNWGNIIGPLEIDFTTAEVDGKKLLNVIFKNTVNHEMTIKRLWLWNEDLWGDWANYPLIKKMTDQKSDTKYFDEKPGVQELYLRFEPAHEGDFIIDVYNPATEPVGCTSNADCNWDNIGAVRYVLNTLFNIKYQIASHEYVRSAPIVAHPWLYQGTFEHPSYFGHFRRFNVEADNPAADWDTALSNRVLPASTGNAAGREVYTAKNDGGDWSKINFDAANVDALTAGLDVTPGNGDTADEIKVIERLRGRDWDYDNSAYVEQEHNKLGGIMHSSPVIIRSDDKDSRFSSTNRPEVAYVGDLYGMLHAIETATGIEKWAYIPSNLLGKLKNDRTDPNADPHFAAVDASPTAKDIYYDHDSNPSTAPMWRTILVCAQGFGGNSIFALDVTDPAYWEVLWEATDNPLLPDELTGVAPGGGMGYSFRAALDKVKVPVLDGNGDPIPGEYEVKWMVYVATSFAHIAEDHGGINVFAFDLQTGTEQWTFSSTYADSVNDIPGAVTTFDIDEDTLADRIYVGDMNGRMWEIALTDDPAGKWTAGQSIHEAEVTVEEVTSTVPIPLFDAGIGNPISVSPAIISRNGHVLLIFGTGGADWASNAKGYHVYAVDATEAANLIETDKQTNYEDSGGAIGAKWSLPTDVGEKVWSAPTVSAGQIWIVTSFGSMESADPKSDKGGSSKLRLLNLDTGENIWDEPLTIGKVRGSIYVSRKHVYMTTFDGEIIQLGDDDFTSGTGNRVVLKSWQDR